MDKIHWNIEKRMIMTYPQPDSEELPMFAENRVHQRTSGRPYPNKVVLRVNRKEKQEKEYEVVILENEYLKIEILPEIGGRIFAATDKTTGYDFFYRQHVIKPALIGVLGSWISGGVEFNWPFHHRTSGFKPCDYVVKQQEDGTVCCYLSEHDPIDRMKGMVCILLRPGEKIFETKMRLFNRTECRHSFLWWENAAVPVHEEYQIFFPQDVTYVNFHYLKSRTTFPMAGHGVYNGISMKKERDISYHRNTRQATSYFACASDYDFFGGYDHRNHCGVVHIGDHHITPGKKMFTWAYGQLSKSWEAALTDTDGQYAELMAGSYSDNQPDFSWLAPYETKEFSQYWYPISEIGTPVFANANLAVAIDHAKGEIRIQPTKTYRNAKITILDGGRSLPAQAQDLTSSTNCNGTSSCQTLLAQTKDLTPNECSVFYLKNMPSKITVSIQQEMQILGEYQEIEPELYQMPEPISDMPSACEMNSTQELYLAGVHVRQYRDPAVMPDGYWKEALRRDPHHIPSLIAMAEYEYMRKAYSPAESYAKRAISELWRFNTRLQGGEAYYVYALILEAKQRYKEAYDYYYKASWCADYVNAAMTRIAMLDIRKKDYEACRKHAQTALRYSADNETALAVLAIASKALGVDTEAILDKGQKRDPVNPLLRYLAGEKDFFSNLKNNPMETCLDLAGDFDTMGRYEDIIGLFTQLRESKPDMQQPMTSYVLGYYKYLLGEEGLEDYQRGMQSRIGETFPSREIERRILTDVGLRYPNEQASMLLGSLYYHDRHYEQAAELFAQGNDWISKRNLAVAYFSHLGRRQEALELMQEALRRNPKSEQLVYETVVLMDKLGTDPMEKVRFLTAHVLTRDDCQTELAKAYNQAGKPKEALETLLSHAFVPCEGGEHAIAEQYFFSHLLLGAEQMKRANIQEALSLFQKGQELPQSLGAGIWNPCKLVPLQYLEACCYEKLGKKDQAEALFHAICEIEIEYFSNMHLKELPYFQALAYRHLGEEMKGRQLITKYRRQWEQIRHVKDDGFYATTPFFISFIDQPECMRSSQYHYLMALLEAYMGHTENAQRLIDQSVRESNGNYLKSFFACHYDLFE